MPKRKLSASASCSRRPTVFEGTEFCHRSSQVVLSDLPDEVLQQVFAFLDPQSLGAISNLNIRRLNYHTNNSKSVDFSVCNTIGSQDLISYFNRERVTHIKEINFNNLFFVQSSTLATCIKKCKNVTKLYVFNCGISYAHIISIIENCRHLEELYWSIKDENFDSIINQKTKVFENIKKVYLHDFTLPSTLVASKLICMCPSVAEFVLNFSPCYVTSLPANSATKYFTLKLRLRHNLRQTICILLECEPEKFPVKFLQILEKVNVQRDREVDEVFLMDGPNVKFYLTYVTSFLQFFDNGGLCTLSILPDEYVKAMVLILTQSGRIINQLNHLTSITGKALKHLSLYKFKPDADDNADSPYDRDALCSIVASSCNITVLDLSEFHLKFAFPFSALCHLKKLKVFNVSTCCFVLSKEQEYSVEDYLNSFQNFVLKCNKVETFCIYDCKARCKSPPMNDLLVPVSKWPELKCLIVQNVKALRECQFLLPIADSCHKLQFLEFVAVGDPKVCLFMQSIKHLLMNAKELKFLRINHAGFYPLDPLLWNNIEKAQKLQGLCLSTKLSTCIVNKTILDAIKKLPYLHLFHLLAKKSCENFAKLVKQVMTDNGVKFPVVETTFSSRTYKTCESRHFPIE